MEPAGLLQSVGRGVIHFLDDLWGTMALLKKALTRLPALTIRPVRLVFFRQIYFTGVEALGRVTILAALIGIVIITQVSSLAGMNAEVTGRILVWSVVRELGPLFAAIVVIVRSCTAVAAELGSMKINDEVKYITVMGIDPYTYLVMPRIAGMTVSLFVLTFFFQIVAVFGGMALSSLLLPIPFLAQIHNIFASLELFDLSLSLVKSLVFGMALSAGSCYHGLQVRTSITEIPQATTKAVMQSLSLVVLMDVLITMVFFV